MAVVVGEKEREEKHLMERVCVTEEKKERDKKEERERERFEESEESRKKDF